jgi:hypothetical protein
MVWIDSNAMVNVNSSNSNLTSNTTSTTNIDWNEWRQNNDEKVEYYKKKFDVMLDTKLQVAARNNPE